MDSDFALFHMQRALWDPVDPTRIGSLDDSLHASVNGEVYRFADGRNRRRFQRAPVLWCGLLRDPVTGERFWPSTASPHATWNGGPYYFNSDSSRAAFLRAPRRYEVVRVM